MKRVHDIAVYEYGSKNNPAIIFVHGFPMNANMWKHQVEALQDTHYCITYDLHGLGNSLPGDGQHTMESFVDDFFSVLDELKVEKFSACGLSMGGYLILRAYERAPERFEKIILCDSRSEADDNNAKIARSKNIKRVSAEGNEAFVSSFIPTCVYEPNIHKMGAEYSGLLSEWKNNGVAGIKGCLLAIMTRTDTTHVLENLQAPSLLICGEQDSITPVTGMMAMAAHIPGGELVVVPEAGHISPLENPSYVNEALISFLKV
jgi:pimeloyl-ACP methyl ester carboxylesterase